MIQVFASLWELIFFLWTSPKWYMGEFEKAMWQGLELQSLLIFGL